MQELLLQVYQTFNLTTPLATDCGAICQKRCCSQPDMGMLLLPGEAELLKDQPGYRLEQLPDGYLLICSGSCLREWRPFACRIFPLFPLVTPKENHRPGIRLIYDPRGRQICPLAASEYPLRQIFQRLVYRSTRLLLQDETICNWLTEFSAYLEAMEDIRLALTSE